MSRRLIGSANAGLGLYFFAAVCLQASLGPYAFLGLFVVALFCAVLPPRRLRQKVILFAVVVALVFPWAFYHALGGALLSTVTATPIREVAAPGVAVAPGGSYLLVYGVGDGDNVSVFTVCYFLDADTVVAAAHRMELAEGEYVATLSGPGLVQSGSIQVLVDTDAGVLLRGVEISRSTEQRLPLAGTSDIQVGMTAEVISTYGWSGQVTVAGYDQLGDAQYLVLTRGQFEGEVIPGMSGSPVVQNGKIIGFIARAPHVGYSGTKVAFARLAGEVYDGTISFYQRP